MALSYVYQPVARQKYFIYYGTGNSDMSESLAPGKAFELDSIKLHLSVADVSVVDFIMTLSSGLDSVYDATYLSQPMEGFTNVLWHIERPMIFMHNDTFEFTLSMVAGTNVWGLQIQGWTICI